MRIIPLALAAIIALPAVASAQTDTTRRDTTRTTEPRTQREARGDVDLSRSARFGPTRRNYGLTNEQGQELQRALTALGCDPGPVDGIVGPRTREAMSCARSQRSITGNDVNELFSALNLSFAEPAAPMPAAPTDTMSRDTTATPPTDTMMRDTTARDTTMVRDSLMRDSTMRDSTARRDSIMQDSLRTRRDSTARRDTTRDTTVVPTDTTRKPR